MNNTILKGALIITYLSADYRNLVGSFQRDFNFDSLYVFSLVLTLISPIACEKKHSFVSDGFFFVSCVMSFVHADGTD